MEKSNNIEKTYCYKHTCECNRSTSFRTYSRQYRGKRKKVKYKSDRHHALCTKCFYSQEEFVSSKRLKWSHKHRKHLPQKLVPVFTEDMLLENIITENKRKTSTEFQQSAVIKLDAQYLDWSSYSPSERLSNRSAPENEYDQVNSEFNTVLALTNNTQSALSFYDYQHTMNAFNQSFTDEKGVHLFVKNFFEKFNAYIKSAKPNASYTHIHHFSTDLINKLKIVFTCLLQHITDRQHHLWYLPNEEQSPALVQYLSKAYEKTKVILLLIETLVPSRQLEYQAS